MTTIAAPATVVAVPDRTGSVISYRGKRGTTYRIRYRDADGARVLETLGSEADGWTERKAAETLRERLVDVKRDRLRKQRPITLADYAADWVSEYPDRTDLKRSTREGYETIVDRHIVPSRLGRTLLAAVSVEDVDRYIAEKRRAKLSPASINRHLNVLSLIFKSARRYGYVRANPIADVDRPREPKRHRWTILTPAEIARVAKAFAALAEKAPLEAARVEETRAWIVQARVVFLVVCACGLRRGEVLGLRWRAVELAVDAALRVEETRVRGQTDTPKSEASERTIPLDPVTADELFQHRGRTAFAGDDELAFCHPSKGSPLDPKAYARTLRLALAAAKVTRPMRPFHDGRHTAITNDALAENAPLSIQRFAGHSDFRTTQRYIDLAGVEFREEATRRGKHLYGEKGER